MDCSWYLAVQVWCVGRHSIRIDMLTNTILRNKARNAARSGKWDLAASYYQKLCRGRFNKISDAIQFGHALKEAGDIEGALAVYLRTADLHRHSVDAQRQAGLFLRRLGRHTDAASYFARALVLDSNLVDVQHELRDIGIKDAEKLDAITLKGALIGSEQPIKPIGAFARLFMSAALGQARASSRRRDWLGAERAYRAVIKRVPGQPRLLTQLGHALREQGKSAEALSVYRRALLLTPRDPDPYIHMGHALKHLGRNEAALDAYLTSWRLRPGQPEVRGEIRALRADFSGDDLQASGGTQESNATIIERVVQIERSQLAEEPWLDRKQRVIFKYLSGSLAYKE